MRTRDPMLLTRLDFRRNGFQSGLGGEELGIGCFQCPPLGLHVAVNFVEADDVDHPRAQTLQHYYLFYILTISYIFLD